MGRWLAVYAAGEEAVVELLLGMDARLRTLEKGRLNKNSSNSSKPPSSDITKPNGKKRGKGKRRIGGQPGHPKHERPSFSEEEIDRFHDYRLTACPHCNIGTCALQGRSAFDFILQAIHAHFQNTPAPSLLPGST